MSSKIKYIILFVAFAAFSASYAADEVTCTRSFSPANYVPGENVTVTLEINVDEGNPPTSFGVEEIFPTGWTFVSADPTQGYDQVVVDNEHKNGWLMWSLGLPVADTTITYIVTPAEETETKTFTGDVGYGGTLHPTGGAKEIERSYVSPTVGFSLTGSSGPETTAEVTLNVELSSSSWRTVKVDYLLSDGTATGSEDYTPGGETLTFDPGDTSEEIKIAVLGDSIYEGDETIIVTLSNASEAILGTFTHTYTIENDDDPPILEFEVDSSDGFEDTKPAILFVNFSGESRLTAKVYFSITPGTATGGEDYTIIDGWLEFSPGETDPEVIKILILEDKLDEDDETFTVTLSNPTDATIGTKDSHTYTILDDDDPPEVSFDSAGSQNEEAAVPQVTLGVDLSTASGKTVTVNYTVSGTADGGGVDYILDDGTLTFAPGEITKNITITIIDDTAGEADETIIVTLTDPDNADIGGIDSYTYTIDNDDLSSIEFADVSSSGPESDDTVTLAVTLLPAIDQEVTVDYSVTGGTANENVDYDLLGNGTLIFSPLSTTQDIAITIKDDTDPELNETIIVTLSNPSDDATIGTNASHTYTIINDDDKIPPETSGYIPAPNSVQVARDTIIQLHITDGMIASTSGVDFETVSITVEGDVIYDGVHETDPNVYDSTGMAQTVKGVCRRMGTEEDYTFVFRSSSLFGYEQEVDVEVYAKDKANNPITKDYYFHTVMRAFAKNIKVNSDTGALVQNNPATATDSAGNTWVVWDETPAAGDSDIYIGKLPADGSAFEESVPVFIGANNHSNPAIAIDRSNKIIHVVCQGDDINDTWDIFHSSSTNGGINWSDPTNRVNEEDVADSRSDQTSPTIAVDKNGKVSVAFVDNSAGDENIVVATSTDGSPWVTTPVTTDTSAQTEPFITIDDVDDTAYIFFTDAINVGTNGTGTDISGAKSPSWSIDLLVGTVSNQSNPVGVVSNGVIHLLWVDESSPPSIFYGNNGGGVPFADTNIVNIVDQPDYEQKAPSIAFNGTKIFACWHDARYVVDNNEDWDVFFAESNSDFEFGTNILVNDDEGENAQTAPVIGTDKDGNPYLGWKDNRLGDNIFGVATTSVGDILQATTVTASKLSIVQINEGDGVDDEDDVIVEIPAGALPVDIKVTIAKLINPPSVPPGGFGVPYEFGPSGLEFSEPVTITIPHAATYEHPDHSVYTVYWYDPSILPPASPWTQEGISDVEHLTNSQDPSLLPTDDVHAIRFKTTHFTGFGTGGFTPAPGPGPVPVGGGGGGGGGCDISTNGQGNVIEYMLPYVFLTIVWIIIKRKDARNRKTI